MSDISVEVADNRSSGRRSRRGISRMVSMSTKKVVGVSVECRLISVDDVTELFHVGLLIHTHFRIDEFKPNPKAEDDFVRDDTYDGWRPKIVMVNCVDSQWEQFDQVVRVNYHTGDIWIAYHNTLQINESLELQKYPFDRQLFRVGFKSPNGILDKWRIRHDILDFPAQVKDGVVSDNDGLYMVSCELNSWRLAGIEVGLHREDDDPVSLTSSEFEMTILAQRDPKYYLLNFCFVIYIIVVGNVLSVTIDVTDQGDRMSLSLTLLLTAVAFKMVLAQSLPRVGYSTYLDYYIICSFMVLAVGTAANLLAAPRVSCLYIWYNENLSAIDREAELAECLENAEVTSIRFDGWFQLSYFVGWTFINLIAAIMAYFPSLVRESWEVVKGSQIGETEDTIARTRVVMDYDNEEKDAVVE